ncbi:MAG: type II toxin-antitoxin system VapC family toxin [Gemmataceae bacterium]
MIILDSDHASVLKYRDSERYIRLTARLALALEPVATTIVTAEEQMRGWLASIAKERKAFRQVKPYLELRELFNFFGGLSLLPFDEVSANLFEQFHRIRIGAMDRKIAAITIANDSLLLTANRSDFEQVPGLRFENWMD